MRTLCLVAALVVLSACDQVTTYGPIQSKSPIPEQQLYIAAEKGVMVADVLGNPFAMPDPRLADIVRSEMENSLLGPDVRFVAKPGPDTVEPYRVVVVFNAEPAAVYDNLCTYHPPSSLKGVTGTMTVSMAFCFGSDPISATWGSVRGVSGPDDPKFRTLIRHTALTLVPVYRPDERSAEQILSPRWPKGRLTLGLAGERSPLHYGDSAERAGRSHETRSSDSAAALAGTA